MSARRCRRDAGLDPGDSDIQATLARCRMLFAKEPNVNCSRKKRLRAFGW